MKRLALLLFFVLLNTSMSFAGLKEDLTTACDSAKKYFRECKKGEHGSEKVKAFRLVCSLSDSSQLVHTGYVVSKNGIEIYFPDSSETSTGRDVVLVNKVHTSSLEPVVAHYDPTPYKIPGYVHKDRSNVIEVTNVYPDDSLTTDVHDFMVKSVLSINRTIAIAERSGDKVVVGHDFYYERYQKLMGGLRSEALFTNQVRRVFYDGKCVVDFKLSDEIRRTILSLFNMFNFNRFNTGTEF